jgi:hypothetical protein
LIDGVQEVLAPNEVVITKVVARHGHVKATSSTTCGSFGVPIRQNLSPETYISLAVSRVCLVSSFVVPYRSSYMFTYPVLP